MARVQTHRLRCQRCDSVTCEPVVFYPRSGHELDIVACGTDRDLPCPVVRPAAPCAVPVHLGRHGVVVSGNARHLAVGDALCPKHDADYSHDNRRVRCHAAKTGFGIVRVAKLADDSQYRVRDGVRAGTAGSNRTIVDRVFLQSLDDATICRSISLTV